MPRAPTVCGVTIFKTNVLSIFVDGILIASGDDDIGHFVL